MADNVNIIADGGTAVAADDVSGVKYQRIKLDIGADGATTPITASTPLPVEEAHPLSEIEVSNFPTTIDVGNFPTEFDVGNFPTEIEVNNQPTTIEVTQDTAANLKATVEGEVDVGNFPTVFDVTQDTPGDLKATVDIASGQSVKVEPGTADIKVTLDSEKVEILNTSDIKVTLDSEKVEVLNTSDIKVSMDGEVLLAGYSLPAGATQFQTYHVETSAQTNHALQAHEDNKSIFITDIFISNGATAGYVSLLDGSGGTVLWGMYCAANGGCVSNLKTPIKLTASTDLCLTSTSCTTHTVTITGYIV